jgi:hypothetical protein
MGAIVASVAAKVNRPSSTRAIRPAQCWRAAWGYGQRQDGVSERLRVELRRAVERGGGAAADAETALSDGPTRKRLTAAIRALAAQRGPTSSTCPSDAARVVGGEKWRDLMTEARDVARELAKAGAVEITQRNTVVDPDVQWRGPIRIRAVRADPAGSR